MKINTVLSLGAVSLVVATAVIASIAVYATRETDRIASQGNKAEEFIKQVFELNALTQTYLERHEERPKAQWHAQFASMGRTIDDPVFGAEPGRSFIPALRSDMAVIKSSFDGLVAMPSVSEAEQSAEKLVAGDMLVKMQRLISGADNLSKKAFAERVTARSRTDRLIFVLLGLLAATAIAVVFILYRRIVRPILKLQEGASIVGKGKLDYKVGIAAQDEIGQLSRAFDDMTSRLKTSYETLEDKVKERTRQLEEAKKKNEVLLQSIGDGIVAIDLAWNIIQWNPAASKMTGWSEREAMGRPFRDIIKFYREHDRSENVLFISDAMLSKKVRSMESRTVLVRKDGTEIPVGDSAAPIIGEAGEVQGAIIAFRDITQEQAAQQIRSSYAYAHHQLRTPVTVASWSIQSALDEEDPAAIKKSILDASRAMKSVQKLTESLIVVSEIDNGMIATKIERMKVAALIKGAVALVRDKAAERRVKLGIDPLPATAAISTDKKLFQRVLLEVLDNAIEYSPAGTEVRVRAVPGDGDIRFEVADNGIGIHAAQQNIVFTKFFRGQNIPEGSIGAGLGLYIAKEYLKSLNGRIWFESKEKSGTTFYITVPV